MPYNSLQQRAVCEERRKVAQNWATFFAILSLRDANLQLVLFALVDGVFLQDAGTAGAVAKAHDGTVDAEVGLALVLELVVVGVGGQILGGVGQG